MDNNESGNSNLEERLSVLEARLEKQTKFWKPIKVFICVVLGLIVLLFVIGVIQFVAVG